jgi:hypothetical protein
MKAKRFRWVKRQPDSSSRRGGGISYLMRTLALAACVWWMAAAPVWADGVTLITHGWNPDLAGTPGWLGAMRDDIAAQHLDGQQRYGTITVTGSAGNLTATCDPWNVDLTSDYSHGEIIVILDWSAVANHLTTHIPAQEVAAVVVDKLTTSQNGQPPLAELPIHLVGHSRGGGMVCELARLLGERGVVVDHVTPLDPHPLTEDDPQPTTPPTPITDTIAAIYENVLFADVYWQDAEYPMGESITGAFHRLWDNMAGGYEFPQVYPNHRDIYLMYQGTIKLTNPVNNTEASMGADERDAWFNAYESDGDHTGFYYSRIKGEGDRLSADQPNGADEVRDGYHSGALFGGDGPRDDLTWDSAVWPNVATLTVENEGSPLGHGAHSIPTGDTLDLDYVYLDYDSACTITLHADADRNPYNDNDIAAIGSAQNHSATGETYAENTVAWDTTGTSAGTTAYVYAKATDGTRTRYLYAAAEIEFVAEGVIWDNGGGDNKWSTEANWSEDTAPTADSVVVFNNTSDADATMDTAYSVAGVFIDADYDGAIDAGSYDLTVDGHYKQSGGGFTAPSGEMSVSGDFDHDGGTFTHNNGTVTFGGSGAQTLSGTTTFYNLTADSGATLVDLADFTVDGTLTNNGALQQTQEVNGSNTVFLNVKDSSSQDKYFGLEIDPGTSNMGSTTVTIWGNQLCPNASSGVQRCFELDPTTSQAATVKFYYTEAERNGEANGSMNVYHWNGSSWDEEAGSYNRGGSDDGQWVQVTGVDEYSPFGLGDGNPTVVTLRNFTARTGLETRFLGATWFLGALVALGAVGGMLVLWMRRR